MADATRNRDVVAIAAIIGLVVLNIFAPQAPDLVNIGLIGAALGAKIEDLRSWYGKK